MSINDAWQAALAAEHQAVFGYALLGPRLSADDLTLAIACSDAHETLRDDTEAELVAAGHTPVAALADYPALYPVTDSTRARQLAVRVENGCAAAWRYLYATAASGSGTSASARRTEAQTGLSASAMRASRWARLIDPDRATTAFPGL